MSALEQLRAAILAGRREQMRIALELAKARLAAAYLATTPAERDDTKEG